MRITALLLMALLSLGIPAQAGLIVKPFTIFDGQTTTFPPQLNADYDTIYTEFNGNITDANITGAAAIPILKLFVDVPLVTQQAPGNYAFGTGFPSDTQPRITTTSDGTLLFAAGGIVAPDIGLRRSAANILQIFVPGGGIPVLDMNNGLLANDLLGSLATPLSITSGGTNATTIPGAQASLSLALSGSNTNILSIGGLTTPLALTRGGTGQITAAAARTALSAADSPVNTDITALNGLTTPLSIAQGGTNLGAVLGANNALGMNAANTAYQGKTIQGTGFISVIQGVGSYTISTTSGATGIITVGNYAIGNNATTTIPFTNPPTAGLIHSVITSVECTTAELGYSVGDRAEIIYGPSLGLPMGVTWEQTGNNIYLLFPINPVLYVPNKATPNTSSINNANWQVVVQVIPNS